MPIKAFDDLQLGFVPDQPAWKLPAGAFTDVRNFRFRDGAAERIGGTTLVPGWGSLSATGVWAAGIQGGGAAYWVYANQNVVYATDGASTANLTSATASMSADLDLGYTGGPYNGYLILNDGTQNPRSWAPGIANRLVDLAAWPASTSAQVIRPFKQFLFAFRLTESGTYNGNLIRWSESAQPGNLPSSWDYTDPANDSGRTELGQTSDPLVDALPLRNSLMIYKERNTWVADFVGGKNVFAFRQVFSQVGMLTENCAVPWMGKHFVVTLSDIVIHDGNEAQSILDDRARSWLFGQLDTTNYRRSFAALDWKNREIWFCYPESGATYPNMALVWNWQENTLYPRDLGQETAWAATGILPSNTGNKVIDSISTIMDNLVGATDVERYNPTDFPLLLFGADTPIALQNDEGGDFNGTAITSYLERSSVELMKDINRQKKVLRIYPKILGANGDTIDIYVGTRAVFSDSTTWFGPYTFTIGTDYKIDCAVTGRIIDLRFSHNTAQVPRLFGYDVEWFPDGWQ